MNKLIIEKNSSQEIYLDSDDSKHIIEILDNASVKIYHYVINKSNDIEIYLKGVNATVEYFYSTINTSDNYLNIKVNHLADNTQSNLVNHGVNIDNNRLHFRVDGIIPKNIVGCLCNQDNKIMNLKDGKSSIEPNLLVDSFDSTSNHAAYIGNFKEDVLFYLKSRGISLDAATLMLTRGFLLHDGKDEKTIEFIKEIDNRILGG